MTTQLVQAIQQALGALQPTYAGSASASDLYEAALFAASVEAARNAGGNATIVTPSGSPPGLRFRKSPGSLWTGKYTYAAISFPNYRKQLEAHLGVFVVGDSKVAHECDVALLDASECQRSRIAQVHPRRRSGLVACVEAKYYVSSPGIAIGRMFIGLSTELGHDKSYLAFPAKGASNLATLLAARRRQCFDEFVPGSPAAKRFTSLLDHAIRNWLARP